MYSNNEKIRVTIVGLGHGVRVHLPALRAAGFDVVGLVGRDLVKTKEIARTEGIEGAFTCLEEAISVTRSEAVTIASPPSTHGEMVIKALRNHCHVMCEKPFAINSDEARNLLQMAESAGVSHLIGNQMRASPEKIVVSQLIKRGLIGEPRLALFTQYVNLVADSEAVRPDWWFNRELGGGWLGASGSHVVDLVRYWLGEFDSLSAMLTITSDRSGVAEDSYNMRFTLKNGVNGIISQTGASWGENSMTNRVMGTHGSVWIDAGRVFHADKTGTKIVPIPAEIELVSIPVSDDPKKRYLHIELPPTIKMFEGWKNSIKSDGVPHMFSTFSDGFQCMRVIDAARESSNAGGILVNL